MFSIVYVIVKVFTRAQTLEYQQSWKRWREKVGFLPGSFCLQFWNGYMLVMWRRTYFFHGFLFSWKYLGTFTVKIGEKLWRPSEKKLEKAYTWKRYVLFVQAIVGSSFWSLINCEMAIWRGSFLGKTLYQVLIVVDWVNYVCYLWKKFVLTSLVKKHTTYYCIFTAVYVVCILEVNSTYLLQCQGEVAQFMVVHLHCDIQIYPSSKFNFCNILILRKMK